MAIYDCFQYFNEDHVVDLRFNILNKYVDYFVISESTKTHQGKSKKLNFDINKFSKFKNKIKYIVADFDKNVPFDIHGSDERQFSSQAFRINTVTIAKSKYYDYAQYHSSADDLTFVKSEYILKSLKIYMCLIEEIENQKIYKSEKKYCEPMLSKYGLYPEVGGEINPNIGFLYFR